MKQVTEEMIRVFNIRKLGYDFMGYKIHREQSLSFHHLIIPKRESRKVGIGDGYVFWNGAILVQNTSHDYLHLIERIDRDIFLKITNEMIQENLQREINIKNLKRIREYLLAFEEVYDKVDDKGRKLIKTRYKTERIDL